MVKKKFARISSCFLTMAFVVTSTLCMGTFSASAASSDTEPAGSGGATAVLNNEAGWSTCNVYYWGNSGNPKNADWPGRKLTDADKNAEGYYEVQISSEYLAGQNGVIFNNGGDQSSDLPISEGDCKIYNNKTKSWVDYDSSQLKLSLSTDAASPQYKGTGITLTASASGGSGSLTYTFKADSTTLYTGENNTTVWTPSAAGTYTLSVSVSDGSGNTNSKSMTYEIKDDSSAEEPILKGISTGMEDNKGVINTAVPITVNAAGGNVGTKLLFYKIAVTDPSGNAVNTVYYRQSKTLEFTPTQLGDYSADVTVQNSYNATVNRKFTIKVVQSGESEYTKPVLSAFTANPTSGTVNSAVTLSATVQAGTGAPNFTYTYQVNGTTVATKTASSRSSSYSWTPEEEGTYTLKVSVRDSKGNTASKTISSYTVSKAQSNAPVISSATVSADTAKVNDTVAIKTVVKSGTGTPNFKYTVKINDTTVKTAKDVSSRSYTYNWTPTTAGTYKIEVVVNDADGGRASKVISSTFKVTGDPVTVIDSFTIAKTRVGVGETVALTTKVKSGTGKPDFRYVIKANDERLYSFTTSSRTYTYNWTPTAKGTYNFTVVVFDASGKNVQATIKNVKVVTNPTPIIESVTADKSSANVGDTVAITTKVLAGTGTAPFKYTVRINDYSVKTSKINSKTYTYNWQPTQAGTYKIEMFVYNSDGTLARKVLDKAYVVNGYTAPVISSATLSKSSANTGDTVAIKTTVKSGTGSPNFKYTVKINDSTVVTAKDVNSRTYTYNWKPTEAGTYKIEVVVNDNNGGRASKVISSTYKVTKVSYILGDVNGDKVVDSNDSAYLMGYLGGDTTNYH